MPRVSRAKLDILQRIQGGAVVSARDGQPFWRGSRDGPKRDDVKALVAAGYLAMLNPQGHAMSTGQRFAVTEKGAAPLVPPEPEGDDEEQA